jgi:hypothetical protein
MQYGNAATDALIRPRQDWSLPVVYELPLDNSSGLSMVVSKELGGSELWVFDGVVEFDITSNSTANCSRVTQTGNESAVILFHVLLDVINGEQASTSFVAEVVAALLLRQLEVASNSGCQEVTEFTPNGLFAALTESRKYFLLEI